MPDVLSSIKILPEATLETRLIEPEPGVSYPWLQHVELENRTIVQSGSCLHGKRPSGTLSEGLWTSFLPELTIETFRWSTDRNKNLLLRLKDMPRIWKMKEFQVRDICKAKRYYNHFHKKWLKRRVMMNVQRMVPVKRDLRAILKSHSERQANDLRFQQVTYPLLGNVVNAIFRWDDPYGWNYQRELTVNGSMLVADWVTHFSNWETGNPQHAYERLALVNWGPFIAGTTNPVGWPGSYKELDETTFASYITQEESLDNRCLMHLYSKIKNAKLDLATGLAEAGQTISLINSMAISIGKAFLQLKLGNLFSAIRAIAPTNRGEISNAFLAFRYGVEPLMNDIQGMAEHLAERILDMKPLPVRASKRFSDTITAVYGDLTLTTTTVIDIKYKVTYVISGSELLSNLSRLGFTSPANVLWEKIPFSFVVDWFLPIGNFLGSLSALDGYEVREITRTVAYRRTIVSDIHVPTSLPTGIIGHPYAVSDVNFQCSVEQVKIKRELLPFLPSLPLPSWRNPFTIGRAANALALLSQMFRGK